MTESHPNDRRFFTNEPGATLFDRFGTILDHARHFDMLVGYFRTSGYKALHQKLSTVEKHRILVGLNVDQRSYDLFSQAQQGQLNFESHSKAKEEYTTSLVNELEHGEDAPEVEESARQFIEALQSGRLELRAFPSQDLHAKVYISRFPEGYPDFGRVITGSSNFSLNGLLAQREFNVELKDRSDVDFALQKFEELWQEGVDVSAAYVDTVRNKTWLSDTITPYDIYLKFLFEYFQEDINLDNEVDIELPEGFMDLAYQKQAVVTARKILEAYNGVFIADVVGLGKTYISAMLLQGYPGRKLVICPPPLENYWKETFLEFGVRGTEVRSLGKLDDILEKGVEKYQYVLIDEAHRFRTDTTQTYEKLHRICWGKRVILVSATPLNNRLEDILSLLKLFQPARKGTIPGVPNLEDFFKKLAQDLKAWDKNDPGYLTAVKEASEQVREKVLSHVMVRRTRTEIQKYFSEDLKAQRLSFPTLAAPQRIIYEFDGQTEEVFDDTMTLIQDFQYTRYTPLLYLKQQISGQQRQGQRNVGGFMKGILVKRLESSFHAFRATVDRFIASYERGLAPKFGQFRVEAWLKSRVQHGLFLLTQGTV
ncbi:MULTISPECIES: SNF2-related protein [unclassified Deinococcus]|uniref:SNF2-related protein n=1 Tax=unclassified Deinococcus TaxID=2623546 RepID=UPI001C308622|nr:MULTISPECIES: SNF2-related protein [unclassified Deinococcus]MDK2014545.1 SNF2-related protein [Deinococcus sp. 43]